MRRVLVTGMSGLGRSDLFEQLESQVVHHDLGEAMRQIAKERGLPYSDSNILRASTPALAALRAAAISRIFPQSKNGAAKDGRPVIISAHGLFMLTDRISEGLTSADVAVINPDLMITLIDAPQRIHDRLKEHSGEYFHLTIETIVRWQEFEVFYANQLARDRGLRHFVVPVNQPETFLALVQGDTRPIVYASYPMTHLSDDKKPLVVQFVKRLQEKCIVFDPSAIESSHGNKPYYSAQDMKAIRAHTIVRDLDWCIGINSQAVVAYWPELVFSSGMNDELHFAYENGRETYLVAEVAEAGRLPTLSPFTTYKNKVFWSSDDFFDYLEMTPELQGAFLLIQNEMMDMLQTASDTGTVATQQAFRKRCMVALATAKPESWVEAQAAELGALADKVYARWAPVMENVKR